MFPIFITLHSLSLFKLPEGMNFLLCKYSFWRIYNLLVANLFSFCLKISLFCPHSWKILLLDKEFYNTAIIIEHVEDTIPFLQTSLVATENSALSQSLLYRQTFFFLSLLFGVLSFITICLDMNFFLCILLGNYLPSWSPEYCLLSMLNFQPLFLQILPFAFPFLTLCETLNRAVLDLLSLSCLTFTFSFPPLWLSVTHYGQFPLIYIPLREFSLQLYLISH